MEYEWAGEIDYIGDNEFMVRATYASGEKDNLTFKNSIVSESDKEYFEPGARLCKVAGENKKPIFFIDGSNKPKHPLEIDGKSMKELAREVADLRYDALAEFLQELRGCFLEDSIADRNRGYKRVAKHLSSMSNMTKDVEFQCKKLWKVCEPKMVEK